MAAENQPRAQALCVFADTSVLYAAVHSYSRGAGLIPPGASLTLLQMGQAGVIHILISQAVLTEARRTFQAKAPHSLSLLDGFAALSAKAVPNPVEAAVRHAAGYVTDLDDAPILAAAAEHGCAYLVTLNSRHFPGEYKGVTVLTPGELVAAIRRSVLGLPPPTGARPLRG